MPSKNISDIISTTDLIADAFKAPVMRIKPRSTKRPDKETALKVVRNEVERRVIAAIADEVKPIVEGAYEDFLLMNGDITEAPNADEWELALDDAVEPLLEPYVPYLSQSWLGQYTIDMGLHDHDGINIFCNRLGKEFFKEITFGKTDAQILSNAGIVIQHIEEALEIHNQSTQQEKNMSDLTLDDVVAKIAEHVGKDFDALSVYDDVDLASDDDDGLSEGAAARLGISMGDEVDVLRMERLTHGTDLCDIVNTKIEEYHTSGKKKKAAPKKPAAPAKDKPAAKTPAQKTVQAVAESGVLDDKALPADVLQALKLCGAQDTTMAQMLGYSRGTYNNYVNGKTPFTPTQTQYDTVRNEVIERLNKLHEVLATMDGTEAHVVF
ncbi:hypothetical protein EKK58_09170 [Candidatus Dependentiae bacterium]|nr:MAG: hypothetical protein EKK58_09170 [Candidatus Dependentiae bacterium]